MPRTPTKEQQAVLDAIPSTPPGHNLVVIAGPGSGKTKTLIDAVELAVGGDAGKAERIVAISYTNNSAAELRVRLCTKAEDLRQPALAKVQVHTFHAWVAELAARRTEAWTYAPISLRTASLAVALHLRNPRAAEHTFTSAEIGAAERHFERCETFAQMEERNFNRIGKPGSDSENRQGFDALVQAATTLEAELAPNQISTFGTLMRSGLEIAKQMASGSIDWLFIDEAQDLNSTQMEFAFAVQQATGCRIFAIADDDQGIFKFRGASSQFLQALEKKAESTRFTLTRNHRSASPIVDLCRQWITPNWQALNRPEKKLASARTTESLPVVVLAASGRDSHDARGRHARIILEAARQSGLCGSLGEAAVLAFSPRNLGFEFEATELESTSCADLQLPEEPDILKRFTDLCRQPNRSRDWHHGLWLEFVDIIKQHSPTGYPGLDDLYAALEVIRRLAPQYNSGAFASVLEAIHAAGFRFTGSRPDPDYATDRINGLSLHSSKGMEFRAVWVTGTGYTFAVRDRDEEQGQPNFLGELFQWAANLVRNARPNLAEENRQAIQLENRRLLYVGMSRATDLLLVSAPYTEEIQPRWRADTRRTCQQENAFREALDTALAGVPHVTVTEDADALNFAHTIHARHRHPTWQPPHRYEIESFTSLTRQPIPGEERITEIPRENELPLPQNEGAITGDLFHRVMHLLCSEPDTLKKRLASELTDAALVARVSTEARPQVEALLARFFADTTNQPWTWFANAHSEIRFNHVDRYSDGAPVLIKGFIDLIQYDGAGRLLRIVDWKTDEPDSADAHPGGRHDQQLQLYARALAPIQPPLPELLNYYVRGPQARSRTAFPSEARLPFLDRPTTPIVPAPNPCGAARVLLERCRPHCRSRANGQTSAKVDDLARALGFTTTTFLAQLTPLALREIPQHEITSRTQPPFIGIAINGTRWLNL